MGIKSIIRTNILISKIKNANWDKMAKKAGDFIDEVLDNFVGDKRSEKIKKVIVPAFDRFHAALKRHLIK